MIKGLLLDVKNNTLEVVEIEKGYKALQKVIDVDTFTVITRKFGDVWLDIYADDEGWFKENNPVSVHTYSESDGCLVEVIVGSVFIAKCDKNGETISLTNNDLNKIRENVYAYLDVENGSLRHIFVCKV